MEKNEVVVWRGSGERILRFPFSGLGFVKGDDRRREKLVQRFEERARKPNGTTALSRRFGRRDKGRGGETEYDPSAKERLLDESHVLPRLRDAGRP